MKKLVLFSILLLALIAFLYPEIVLAQPPGLPHNPQQAPIDGGLSLLALSGGAYALKKMRDKRK